MLLLRLFLLWLRQWHLRLSWLRTMFLLLLLFLLLSAPSS